MHTYNEETQSSRVKFIVIAMVIAIIACVLAVVLIVFTPMLRAMGAESIENSVLARANQCYAIEGVYPSSLSYLEDNYGLVLNHDDYVVVYESFANNVAPKVMVTPRK